MDHYHYLWDQNPTDTLTGSEPTWSGGTLPLTAIVPGTWYLHLLSQNTANVSGGTADLGPYYDLDVPVLVPEPPHTPGTSNTLTWAAVPGATSYYAECDDNASFSSPEFNSGSTTGTTYTFLGLAGGTTYYYHVKAQRPIAGDPVIETESNWSVPQQSVQDVPLPPAPTINGLLNDTNFGWDGVTNDPTLDMSGLVSGDTVEYRFSTSGDGGTYGAWGGNNPPQGAVAVEVRQRDGAGNVSAASAPFDFAFDSVAPTVIGVRVTLTTVTDAEVTPRPQDEEVVVVTYDSHLDWAYGRVPALGFTQPVLGDGVGGGPATFTLDPDNSFWIDNGADSGHAVYQFAYTLADNGVYYPHVGVVTQPGTTHDVAGNEPVTHTGTDDFAVNTATAPARIVDAYSNLSLVSGRNAAEAQPRFYVRLDYDQAMAYWPKPVVSFTPDASSTLVYDDADSFWLDNPPTAFWAQFDVASTGMPFTGEAITVLGGPGPGEPGRPGAVRRGGDGGHRHGGPAAAAGDGQQHRDQHAVGHRRGDGAGGRGVLRAGALQSADEPDRLADDRLLAAALERRRRGGGRDVRTRPLAFDLARPVALHRLVQGDRPEREVRLADPGGRFGGVGPARRLPAPYTSPPLFTVDTASEAPAPASVTNIVVYGLKKTNVVTAADAGDTITIFVKYDQAMDNRDAPWVGIYDGGDANAFEFTGGTWNGDHTYAANFVVHDTDLIWNDVRVRVIDAVDVTGRVQYEYNNYSAFSINTVSTPADMAGPLVQSTTTITDATTTTVVHDTGAANFVVLVYYNMDMAGHHPTVTFETFPGYEGAVAAALTPDPDDCGWWNPREYQAAFYVNDVAANVPDVFIDVSGGIDSTSYGDQYFYEGGHFSINIVGPLAQPQTATKTAALTDAVLSSGALDLSVSAPSSSTTQQQTTLTAADRALLYAGTWFEA